VKEALLRDVGTHGCRFSGILVIYSLLDVVHVCHEEVTTGLLRGKFESGDVGCKVRSDGLLKDSARGFSAQELMGKHR
jgi:hypothetical protein